MRPDMSDDTLTIEIDGRRQQVYIAARDLRALFKPPRKSKSA